MMTDSARDGAGTSVPASGAAAVDGRPAGSFVESKAYGLIAALLLGFGGFLAPVAGWLVGVVMVLTSRLWRRWEKAVALLLPVVVAVVTAVVSAVGSSIASTASGAGEARNPLVPASYELWHAGIVGVVVLVPACAAWLIWRLMRTPDR
ncbi:MULTISPECIES: hypothetical protein [Bacteria]|uniref:hypothetical protein n=1 Tax=Bacteria TaxID=2 RepID=UPI003C7BA3AB